MKRADVEKILDESAGKSVGVTFIKKDGSERTLVGRIGKKYTPVTGASSFHGKAARRGRGDASHVGVRTTMRVSARRETENTHASSNWDDRTCALA